VSQRDDPSGPETIDAGGTSLYSLLLCIRIAPVDSSTEA
jgi:hypothetical protein